MMGTPMDTVMAQLPTSPEITAALLHRSGPLGAILAQVEAYEADVNLHGREADTHLAEARLDAVRWAHATLRAIAAG